ncbi:carboxylesterase/lipase family protein [Arthrobacter sp. ISL-48]|uniref:carboxylesterase family protein n=1 Tax=Arthrobacter sp. ISL-48 TaxID=2819110 RepID=UPI001BE67020|nr:carboxylesterase family protein [Arthrobacter sp. ISL-48]MBT2532561.1 carboxylesterase/lipase family protein [Arthrobacter sp. ISL-48]
MTHTSRTLTNEHPVRAWLGIPFATAERFRRPVLLPFNPDLPYDQKGPAPLQAGDTSWLEADNGFSEHCLNLNVWAPEDAGDAPLPVVVYIFGGGFEVGANTQTTSNASGLAATGRVVGVSLNYRLGPFGWLSLSQYGGALEEATNLGLQDIITALRWVQENIARFGGDPGNVTVTGHSAGSMSSIALLAAPAADGLYQHIASFSGATSRTVPAWWAEELAERLLRELNIQHAPEELLHVDAQLLATSLAKVSPRELGERNSVDNTTLGIVDDHAQPGGVLIGHPFSVVESGRRRDIDILLSSATEEVDYWVINKIAGFDPGSLDHLIDELVLKSRVPRSWAKRIVDAYSVNGRSTAQVRADLFTDFIFTLPVTRAALAHSAAGGTTHRLVIGSAEGAPAVHGTEMYGIVGQERPGASDEQIVRDTFVRDALLTFASGNTDHLWAPVTATPTAKGIGNLTYDPTTHAETVLEVFNGIERP